MNVSRVRVRMYHTDLVGGAFHGRFFDLFEEARTEAFRRAGFHWDTTHSRGVAFVVTHVDCDFFRPTRMDDELLISVFVTKLTRARCVVEYEVRRSGEPELLALGHTDFAFLGCQSQSPGRCTRFDPRCSASLSRDVDAGGQSAVGRAAT